jgi:hypothetical protein
MFSIHDDVASCRANTFAQRVTGYCFVVVEERKAHVLGSLVFWSLSLLLTFNIAGLDLCAQLALASFVYAGFPTVCFTLFIRDMICEYSQSHAGSQALVLRDYIL